MRFEPRDASGCRLSVALLFALGGVLAAAAQAPSASLEHQPLAGTSWRMVEFQSMDDAIGTVRPEDPSLYTMTLGVDGTASFRLNCNRAHGTWSSEPTGDGASGSFELGPLAMTRAICPPPSLDESFARDAAYVRSYLLKDGRLYLSLMADGGIYAWEPDGGEPEAVDEPAAPDDGGSRN